jgi:hypothetical protein
MTRLANTTKVALLTAMSLALAACGKQDDQAASPASASAQASAPAFPTGNAQAPASVADCDKLPDPKPTDDSATSRATAVSLGIAARRDCKKAIERQQDTANADLARIREIKEKEEAERTSRKISDEEWARRVKEAGKAPVKEYKY